MTRPRDLLAAAVALVRGEPVLAAVLTGIALDVATQLAGDGLQRGELVRIAAAAVIGALTRARTTPALNPAVPALPTDPALPAPTAPVLTLSGWRR